MKERYQEIEEKNAKLKETLSTKKPEVLDFLERFEMSWVYHDNALEGVVYTPQELMAALRPGAVAAEASLMPIVLEIRNHKACVEFIREEAKLHGKKHLTLNMALVRRIHDLLSGNTAEAQAARAAVERRERTEKELAKEKERAGFRKDMPLHRTYFHEIAQPKDIAAKLEKLLDGTTLADFREMHPIDQAARMQYGIIKVFPFTDHSGKVGRMISNMILLRHNLLPVIVHSVERQKYYESFRGSESSFRNLFMDAMENSLDNGLKHFAELARRARAAAG
ncbi:MAG: Fic family protein [Myxococcaceae bacterium]|nr:Fic family protein [Myxococcaceae bacterium]